MPAPGSVPVPLRIRLRGGRVVQVVRGPHGLRATVVDAAGGALGAVTIVESGGETFAEAGGQGAEAAREVGRLITRYLEGPSRRLWPGLSFELFATCLAFVEDTPERLTRALERLPEPHRATLVETLLTDLAELRRGD